MGQNFMSLTSHVQGWLNEQGIENIIPVGLGSGCRGVELYLYKTTASEFLEKYPMLETKYYKGYFTKQQFSERIYVSMVKKK